MIKLILIKASIIKSEAQFSQTKISKIYITTITPDFFWIMYHPSIRVFPDYNLCVNWHDLGFAQDAGFSRGRAICQKVFVSKMGKILSIFSLKQSNWFMSFLIQLKNTQFSQNDLRHCQILEDIILKKWRFDHFLTSLIKNCVLSVRASKNNWQVMVDQKWMP